MSSGSGRTGRRAVRRWGASLVGLAAAFAGAPVAAQPDDAAAVSIGESDLYPAVRVDYLVNDNAFATADDETASQGVVLAPSVEWVADRRLLTLNAAYAGAYAAFDEDVLDYADHTLSLLGDAELGVRRRASGGIVYERGHEAFGFGLTRGRTDEFDESVLFDRVVVDGRFRYGAVDARGNVEAGAVLESFRYANLDALTDGLDYASIGPYALFSLRLTGDTRLLLETRVTGYDYEEDLRDRTDFELLTGLEFVATGTLSGAVRVGGRLTRFANDTEGRVEDDENSGAVFEADVTYRPLDYVTLGLTGGRDLANRVDEVGDIEPLQTDLQLVYGHRWSSRVGTRAFVGQRLYERDCPGDDVRVVRGGLAVTVSVRRWLQLGADVEGSRRTFDGCDGTDGQPTDPEITRTLAGVFVRATL